jgi:hypothetical protein
LEAVNQIGSKVCDRWQAPPFRLDLPGARLAQIDSCARFAGYALIAPATGFARATRSVRAPGWALQAGRPRRPSREYAWRPVRRLDCNSQAGRLIEVSVCPRPHSRHGDHHIPWPSASAPIASELAHPSKQRLHRRGPPSAIVYAVPRSGKCRTRSSRADGRPRTPIRRRLVRPAIPQIRG